MNRILDPMLLEEMIQYDDNDEDGNYDRVIAAELALAQAIKMDPIFGAVKEENERAKLIGKRKAKPSLFGATKTFRSTKTRKLFR